MTDLQSPEDEMLAKLDADDAAAGPQEPAGMGEMCVPTSSVSVNEDDNAATPPAEGDTVQFAVEGTVSRVEGDNVYVTPTTINGEPVGQPTAADVPTSPDDQQSTQA